MKRSIRYQGAIIHNDRILLIRHQEHATGHTYWVLPGGGREANETEEACVHREMLEETNLDVIVERLILDDVSLPGGIYQRLKTYLCRVANDLDARPGFEPEPDAASLYTIAEVHWFDLINLTELEYKVGNDPFTIPLVNRVRSVLGYATNNFSNDQNDTA
jgi:8-oxo-dGTP diphosphatase